MANGRKPDISWQEILVNENYLSKEDVKQIEVEARMTHLDPLDAAFSLGLITKPVFGQAIAEYYGVPFADIATHTPPREQVTRIPEEIARSQRRIFFKDEPKQIVIATDHPYNPLTQDFTAHFGGKKVVMAYAMPEDINLCLTFYRKTLDTRFSKIIVENKKIAPEILDEILADAITFRASDIHFEPHDQGVLIRFRIDGLLQDAGHLTKELYENVLNRIKVQARLRTDEHFSAQDGAIRYRVGNQSADVRISILPLINEEKVVMRLLSDAMRALQMSDLGLEDAHRDLLISASQKPFGMILVVGPTGSGKTTTLYSITKILNRPDVNISTIEDPVEYKIPGVNHIQVNTQTNLTFAKGLRSIIRQDPDIILVGEIRDQETADIAVNAALTGHLLLSTFHANDAASTIPRLMEMGVEPFLLSSSIELIVAQRLARRICEACRVSTPTTRAKLASAFPDAAALLPSERLTLYHGKGCPACNGTGYRGRIAVFEMIPASQALRDLIMTRPSAKQIMGCATASGTRPMFFDGLDKVAAGIITFEELIRTIAPPEK